MANKTRMRHNLYKKIDITVLALAPLIAATLSVWLNLGFITSSFLFFMLPALWFAWRTPNAVKHVAFFALTASIPITLVVDYLIALNKGWYIPTVFPFRLFGIVAIEQFFWVIFFCFFVLIFYEHFFDKGRHRIVERRMGIFIAALVGVSLILIAIVFSESSLLRIRYSYFWVGIFSCLLPLSVFMIRHPGLLGSILRTGTYFLYLALVNELTALRLGHWQFNGNEYIGWVSIFNFKFPVEELFFYILICAATMVAYYEFFDESEKHRKIAEH